VREIVLPSSDSRAVFVGKTGCGKTTLAERICSNFDSVCVLDSKGELDWKGYQIFTKLADVIKAKGRIIWQPNPHEQNIETYETLFQVDL
jgi:ABC-type phosphate transport system ATPase subunit